MTTEVEEHLINFIFMTSYTEQKKLVEELEDYQVKMKGKDYYDFDMLRKRIQDEDELDALAVKRLMELRELYLPARSR